MGHLVLGVVVGAVVVCMYMYWDRYGHIMYRHIHRQGFFS